MINDITSLDLKKKTSYLINSLHVILFCHEDADQLIGYPAAPTPTPAHRDADAADYDGGKRDTKSSRRRLREQIR